jgi:hypothetical protein
LNIHVRSVAHFAHGIDDVSQADELWRASKSIASDVFSAIAREDAAVRQVVQDVLKKPAVQTLTCCDGLGR